MLGQRLRPRFCGNELGTGSWLVMLDGSDVVGSLVGGKPVDGVEFLVARAGIATAAARTMADGGEVLNAVDFVFLGGDPLAHEADPDAVREIPVLATYSDAAEVHSA